MPCCLDFPQFGYCFQASTRLSSVQELAYSCLCLAVPLLLLYKLKPVTPKTVVVYFLIKKERRNTKEALRVTGVRLLFRPRQLVRGHPHAVFRINDFGPYDHPTDPTRPTEKVWVEVRSSGSVVAISVRPPRRLGRRLRPAPPHSHSSIRRRTELIWVQGDSPNR